MEKQIINNRTLMNLYKCACEGGIRYSSKTNTIVLVINNTKSGRPNIWRGNIVDFAGRPEKNPDVLTGANRRLENFLENNGQIFLFEVNKPGEYEQKGQVKSAGPYKMEKDSAEKPYPVFPLEVDSGAL